MELLSCLRLIPRKNILRVLEWLATEPVGWRWTIAGDGPQRALIERRIDELGLSSRVKLLGHVDHLELPDLYARFHAYLQPSSEGETWGLAVNEAMASGLPVIVSTKCGCHEDLVKLSINGYLFDPFSASSFKAASDRFVAERHRWEEMGRASVSIVSDWDLGLYARSFWSAARIATQTRAKRDLAALVAKAL
jgi:glycosyltransferase involved in cell wall biosynthesis